MIDPAYKEKNRAATERIKTFAAKLTDAQLQTKLGEHWTVGIMFAHLAFWDRRVLAVLDATEKNNKLTVTEMDVTLNDVSLALWAAIPARESARLAIESAEALDARLENFPQHLLEEVHNYLQRWVVRATHRNTHLDEAEAAVVS